MTRTYNDKEVALILQRALEPAREGEEPHDGDGLSLEQIKDIAAEVGIAPARIEGAVASLVEPDPGSRNPILGIATTVQFQETFEGVEIGEDDMPDLVSVIRASMGRQGIVGSDFGSMEWKASDFLGSRYVSVIPTKGGTRIRALGNFRDGLFRTWALVGMASGLVTAGLLEGTGLGIMVLPFAAAAALIPGPFLYRWARLREDRKLRQVFDRLVALLKSRPSIEAGGAPALPPGESDPDPEAAP